MFIYTECCLESDHDADSLDGRTLTQDLLQIVCMYTCWCRPTLNLMSNELLEV